MDWGDPSLVWFLVGLALFLMELAMPGLVLMFFGMGAWLVAILCLIFNIQLDAQLIIFIVSSVLFLVTLRKYVNKLFSGRKKTETSYGENIEDYLGERAVVVEKISPPQYGKVEFHGTNWSAQADSEIPVGTTIEIIGKKNLTLKVKKV
jgi:membrane protein implicated in regulation of membrane protease activity